MTSNRDNDELQSDATLSGDAAFAGDTAFSGDIELPDDIADVLADEATWEPVSTDLQESIVASVIAEVNRADLPSVDADPDSSASQVESSPAPALASNVVSLPTRWKTAALGAAAALLVVAGLFGIARLAADGPDFEVALAGTDLAPNASAVAEITDTPEGTRIVISVEDLPPAAPGTYYQAWLRKDAAVGVSAGTFHLRSGSDSEIELWAGVSTDEYPLLTVTLQDEAQTESSGEVVLKALIGGS